RGISVRTPSHGRKARPCDTREDGRELSGDLIVERLACAVCGDENIITRPRELEIIHEGRGESVRQFDDETLAGLTPIRTQGREWSIAPEVARRVIVIPGLIDIFDHQVHLAVDNSITTNGVLTGGDRLQYRTDPVGVPRSIGKGEDFHNGKAGGAEPTCRNLVAVRKRLADLFPINLRTVTRIPRGRACKWRAEISDPLQCIRDFGGQHSAALLTAPFLRIEEEDPVLLDRPVEVKAEVVIAQLLLFLLLRRQEEIRLIERVIAEEFKGRAVELIAAGFCDQVDDGALSLAVLRAEAIAFDTEFLNRVN